MLDIKSYNKDTNILVIGDLIIDNYLWGVCERISPEAPVPVININDNTTLLGGAGNVLNNLKTLGANVDIISVIGDDSASDELLEIFKLLKISTNFLVVENNRKTSKKTRILAQKQQIIRYDDESVHNINAISAAKILTIFKDNINNYDIVLISDYGKGLLTDKLTQALINIANDNNKKVLIDPKGDDWAKYSGAYLLTPNKKELVLASNIKIHDNKSLTEAMAIIKDKCNLDIAITTLSEDGIALLADANNELVIYPTKTREIFDVTGAGDTVLASLGFAIANGKNIDDAIRFANLAAGIVISKIGSATASLLEISNYQKQISKNNTHNIQTREQIAITSGQLKQENNTIVFTNGCFDLLHIGHIKYLEQASSYGDKLIVGLNSDASVSTLKGDNRPINNQEDRAYILASLTMVDFVVIFPEQTPYELIKIIKPDVLVKGGDYKDKTVIGSDIVPKVAIVDFVAGKSSSDIINKINTQ